MLADPAIASQSRACPQCAGSKATPLPRYSEPPWRVVQCDACDFVYLSNPPNYEQLVDEFAWEKTHVAEREKRRRRSPVVHVVEKATRWRLSMNPNRQERWLRRAFKPGRVLDIGCGWGDTVPPPYVPFGIEVSADLAKIANERMRARGGRAIQAAAVDGVASFPAGYFSGVVMRGFLEHEKNPRPLLNEVARVTAADGAAYVRLPNFGGLNRRIRGGKWCGFRHPDHVNYFTVASLTRMVEDSGFRLQLCEPLWLPFDDHIKAVLWKS